MTDSLVGRPPAHKKITREYQEPNWGVVSEAYGELRSHLTLIGWPKQLFWNYPGV